jgi:hypothetical protein
MNKTLRTLLGLLLTVPLAALAQGVAFFSDLKGEVMVDGSQRPNLLAEITKGQKITLGKESHASVMFTTSGKEFALRGPGEYVVKDNDVSGSGAPPVARSTEWRASTRVLTQVANTSAASVRMRSIGQPKARPAAAFPADGSISTLQPVFRWDAPEAQAPTEFTLQVVGHDKPVHSAKSVTGGSYRLPAKLRPETEYVWTATSAGAELGAGKFRTLSSDAISRIEKRRPADNASFSDRLNFALLLQEMGAAQEARESWARLAKERTDLPELSALAR